MSFIVVHHLRKGSEKSINDKDEKVRGSTDIVNAVDCLWMVSRSDKTSPYININQEKNRFDKEIEPFTIRIIDNAEQKAISFEVTYDSVQEQDVESRAMQIILKWLLSKKDWSDSKNKLFKTAEVNEQFKETFNKKPERNRKIILSALNRLVVLNKVHRASKGYYLLVEQLDNLDEENNQGEDKNG